MYGSNGFRRGTKGPSKKANVVFGFYGELRFIELTIDNIIQTMKGYSDQYNIFLVFNISLVITTRFRPEGVSKRYSEL